VAALPPAPPTPAPEPVKPAEEPAPAPQPAPEPVHARPAAGSKAHAAKGSAKVAGSGILALHVAPWGDMFVDDKKLESANMMDSVAELPAGPHRLKVTNPRLGERTEQIVIEPSKTLDKKIDLARGR
jgi:hypothetical protein